MGLFRFIWRALKGWLLIGVEIPPDSQVGLCWERRLEREIAELQQAAVTAIGRRNLLRRRLRSLRARFKRQQSDAHTALRAGDRERALRLGAEADTMMAELAALEAALSQVEQEADEVKRQIRELAEEIRRDAAERLARLAEWKRAQIQGRLQWMPFEPALEPRRVSRASSWTEWTGWGMLLALLGILGWRLWSDY